MSIVWRGYVFSKYLWCYKAWKLSSKAFACMDEKEMDAHELEEEKAIDAEMRALFGEHFLRRDPADEARKKAEAEKPVTPKPLTTAQKELLKKIFEVCDSDHTGFMDFNETQDLFYALTNHGTPYEELFSFFHKADSTGDGLLSFQELVGMAEFLLGAEEAKRNKESANMDDVEKGSTMKDAENK